jgi:hypothetical protein
MSTIRFAFKFEPIFQILALTECINLTDINVLIMALAICLI